MATRHDLELLDRARRVARARERDAQLARGVVMIGMMHQLGGEALHRLHPLGARVEEESHAVVRVAQGGIGPQRGAIGDDGRGRMALALVLESARVLRLRERLPILQRRVEGEGALRSEERRRFGLRPSAVHVARDPQRGPARRGLRMRDRGREENRDRRQRARLAPPPRNAANGAGPRVRRGPILGGRDQRPVKLGLRFST